MRKKQWIALILAVAMILSVGIPAYAEETGSANGGEVPSDGTSYSPKENTNDPLTETPEAPAEEAGEAPEEDPTEAPEETTEVPEEETTEAPAEAPEEENGIAPLADTVMVAKIGETEYATLGDAVAAVPDDGTETIIQLMGDATGGGVQVKAGQNIIFDFGGHTYTVGAPTVGSTGTETNGFQLLKGATVTMRNGTVKASDYPNLGIMIQNYCNLTLDDVTLTAAEASQCQYVASNNHGNVRITGNTSIIAAAGQTAFDLYYWPDGGYGDGVTVTVDTTGRIQGKIEYGSDGTLAGKTDIAEKASLVIKSGTVEGEISTYNLAAENETGIEITGGTFTSDVSAYVPDGLAAIGDGGSYTIGKATVQTADHVAVVDGQYFKTVQGAIDAAPEGGEVKLLKDAELASYTVLSKSIVLDLGSNKLSCPTDNYAFGISSDIAVTVQNGSMTGKNGFYCTAGELTLTNVALTTSGRSIANYDSSTVTVGSGSKVVSTGEVPVVIWGDEGKGLKPTLNIAGAVHAESIYAAVMGNGTDQSGTTINVQEGADIQAANMGIFHPQSGTVTVAGGKITGATGIEMRAGTLNVTGGEIIGTADKITVQANNSGSTTSGAGIAVAQHTTKLPVTVNVSGGEISGAAALYESNPQTNPDEAIEKVEIHLTGGDFRATGKDAEAVYSEDKTNFISGGTYSTDVSKYVVEGNQALDTNNDGIFTINPDPKVAFAEVNGLGYMTVQEAVDAAAANGGTVKLLQDATEDVVVSTGSVTIDLNGKTLTNDKSDTLTVKTGAALTVTGDGTVDNKTNGRAAVFNEGTVVLNGGAYDRTSETGASAEVSGENSWYTICNHGDMTVNAGVTVKNQGSFSSMIENGYQSYKSGNPRTGYVGGTNAKNPSLTINGGTFIGGLNTVKNDDGGVLKISGGEFSNTTQAAILNWNQAEITGGKFTVDTRNGVVLNGKDTANTSNEGEVLNQGKLTISGGTFMAPEGVAPIGRMNGNADMSDVNVSGGTFSAEVPEEYCADGFAPQKNLDGTFGVHTHKNERVGVKEATCAEDGYTGDLQCVVCGELVEKGEAIPAKGHSFGTEWKSDESGHWHACAVCGEKAESAAHSFKWVVDKEATETEAGSKHEECGVCGYKKAAVEIPATGTPVKPTEPKPTEPKPTEPDVPKTGDETNLTMMIAVMAASMLGIGVMAALLTKKNYTGKYQK